MALRFFWRCEATTLTTDVDYSIGDTDASTVGTPALNTTAVKVGTNGLYTNAAVSYYTFNTSTTAIALPEEGALGYWFQFPSAYPTVSGYTFGIRIRGADASNYIDIQSKSSGNLRLLLSRSGGTTNEVATTSNNMVAGTWYFVVARWDSVNGKAKIEVYEGTSETPGSGRSIEETGLDTTATGAFPPELSSSTGLQIGNMTGAQTNVFYIDNVFIADSYDEPLHLYGNRDITDIDDYDATGVVKYLKVLTHASAASATGVNGIVFASSAGIAGAEIGEFTNKTFEATLEGGKAVLKVPVADFGGSALTTSDTPVALVRNTTKTTGIISCTVIEE